MTGIAAVGAYAPRFRIADEAFEDAWGRFEPSGIDEKALPNADEDALTMGREAAVRTLGAAGIDGAAVDFLAFATTNPPVEEGDLTARLGAMLGVPDDATRQTFGASTRAGTRALAAALDAGPGRGLVVAADCPEGAPDDRRDHAAGAGAAALLLTPGGAADVVNRAEYAEPYPGTRFRRRGSETIEGVDVTEYDRAAFREPVVAAVEALDGDFGDVDADSTDVDADSTDVDAAAIQAPDGGLPYRAAGAMGLDSGTVAACETVSELGDTGAASAPLSLARALADGHERVLVVGWGGSAGADALLVERTGEVAANLALEGSEQVNYADYVRRRGVVTSGPPEGGGAYVSLPSWKRTVPQRYRLIAGRCPDCGALAFPPEGACRECGSLGEYEDVELPGTGTVEAVTGISQGAAPPEFAEQQSRSWDFGVAIVAFDGPEPVDPGRDETVSAPAQVLDGHDLAVGDRVEATVRRIYTQEGVTRYGFKVRPAE
jgi:hydroxymethylglutaryl-CoA synthase